MTVNLQINQYNDKSHSNNPHIKKGPNSPYLDKGFTVRKIRTHWVVQQADGRASERASIMSTFQMTGAFPPSPVKSPMAIAHCLTSTSTYATFTILPGHSSYSLLPSDLNPPYSSNVSSLVSNINLSPSTQSTLT